MEISTDAAGVLGVFVAALSLDFVYTRWVQSVLAGRAWLASGYTALWSGINLFAILKCVDNHYLAVPYLLGGACGTFLAVRWSGGGK